MCIYTYIHLYSMCVYIHIYVLYIDTHIHSQILYLSNNDQLIFEQNWMKGRVQPFTDPVGSVNHRDTRGLLSLTSFLHASLFNRQKF